MRWYTVRERYRDRYFKGYVVEKSPGKKPGKFKKVYVYHGDYYYWRVTQAEMAKLRLRYLVFLLADMAIFFLAAGADSRASRSTWTMVAALLSLIPLLSEIIAMIQLFGTEDKVREFEFNELNTRIRWSTFLRGVILAAGSVLAVIWAFITREWTAFLLLAAAFLLCAGCSLAIYFSHRSLGSKLVEEGDYGDIVDETYSEKNIPVVRKKRRADGKRNRK